MSRWSWLVLRGSLWVVLLVAVCSCGGGNGDAPSSTGVDLVRLFPLAELYSEVDHIELGSADAEPLLVEGWGHDHGVDSYAWGMGDRSLMRFYVGFPRDLDLRLSGRRFQFEGAPSQEVRIKVNGRQIERLEFETLADSDQRLRVPGDALVEGFNELELIYGYSRRPKKVVPGSDDYRPLAMQWDTVEFIDLRDFGRPEVRPDKTRPELLLPRHSGIDYYLQIEPATTLTIDRISTWGEAESLALEVVVGVAGTENETVMRVESPFGRGEPVSLPLDLTAPQIARLSLRAVSVGDREPQAAGLRLVKPVLTSEDPDKEPETRAAVTAGEGRRQVSETRPNIVLYIIDTLRADHLGCYGYPRPTSPRIDAFADGATRFARVAAQSAWTKPAVATILTGLYAPVHGANSVSEVLTDEIPTLAEALADSGYDTAGFVTNSVLSRDYGFDQGFHHFEYLKEVEDREFHQLSDRVNESVFSWLDDRPQEKPFFICVHTMDPHAPYTPRSPFAQELAGQVRDSRVGRLANVNGLTWKDREPDESTAADLMALYDGEIAFNDEQFGRLLAKLEALNMLESSIVVLVSDHGEEFGDHGRWQHGFTLFQEMLQVPLVIKFPFGEGAGVVVDSAVGQVDIVPTVLEAAGLVAPSSVQGRSLMPLIVDGGVRVDSTPLYSDIKKQRWRDVSAVIAAGRKLVWYRIYDSPRPQFELYDLERDPGETDNLATREPIWAGYLASILKGAELSWAGRAPTEESVMNEEMEERLRALGYLQ